MRQKIMEGIQKHLQPIAGFDKIQLLEVEPGHAKISIDIPPEALNMYGNLHGGFLFTLCDIVSGMAAYAYEISNVTLQGNINYVKGISSGLIFVEANTVHKGRKTAVNQITIKDSSGALITTAVFTMFFLDPID